MSNATLPPPRRASSAALPVVNSRDRSDSSSGEGDFDTSLDQSIYSSTKEEASSSFEERSDNKQRRKRTSPQDQAILEAEYKQNPKPNKAARAEIVEKVSLNEKEVQIWFQNRRQINRRKSRPLLPHEIAAFGLGGMVALSSDPASTVSPSSSQSTAELSLNSQPEATCSQKTNDSNEDSRSCQDDVELSHLVSVEERVQFEKEDSEDVAKDGTVAQQQSILKEQFSSDLSNWDKNSSSATESVVKSFSSTPGYLANRWNSVKNSFTTPASSQMPLFVTPPIHIANHPASCPERAQSIRSTPSSQVRLSMSLDGKAELVSNEASPPRPHTARSFSSSGPMIPQQRMRGLQRSQSALPLSLHQTTPGVKLSLTPRLPTGRSRDARTWEFCCDSEARDQLTTQAENESHGSAVAAISLIRSTSISALKSNNNKRNAPAAKSDLTKNGKKPKLGRAMSSLARLQNHEKVPLKISSYDKDGLMRSPSGDSDKENWVPNEGGNSRRRPLPSGRPNHHSQSKAILGDNQNILSHAFDFGGSRNRKRKPGIVETSIFEDQENSEHVPEEVEKFMRGEISPSKKGDLDCVQGLLSLSQGNWR